MMNKLKLNENKNKLLGIDMDNNIIFKMKNVIIKKVNWNFITDKELKFNDHMEFICKKIGFFKRIRNRMLIITSINIYNTTIKPCFEFGSAMLYSCCSDQQIIRLQKLQNKAMRAILKVNRFTSTSWMLDELKWLNVRERLQVNTIYFIRKMKICDAPDYLIQQLRFVGEVLPYSLRNDMDFRIQQANTTARQKSLYKGLNLYNMLPFEVKN